MNRALPAGWLWPSLMAGLVLLECSSGPPPLDTSPGSPDISAADSAPRDMARDAGGGDQHRLADRAVERPPADGHAELGGCKGDGDCNDTLLCTTDTCTAAGSCSHVVSNGCLINNACIAASATNPNNACERCLPAKSTTGWSLSGCVTTLAGGGLGYKDGPASSAQFSAPSDVAVDANGAVYVADGANNRIRMIAGGQVTTFAGSGCYGTGWAGCGGYVDGPALAAQFYIPMGVVVTASGGLIVADWANHRVRTVAGGQVGTLAGTGVLGLADGAALSAQFSYPRNLAVDSAGTVYVADSTNHVVRTIAGGVVSTLAGTGKPGYVDGPAATAMFQHTVDLAVDGAGKVYVADMLNHRIRVIANGQVTTLAGSGCTGSNPCDGGYVDGPALAARFSWPRGIAVDGAGKVFVADGQNHRIRVISNGQVTTLAGSGCTGAYPACQAGFADGPLLSARFNTPCGMAVGADGELYIADKDNQRIRLLVP